MLSDTDTMSTYWAQGPLGQFNETSAPGMHSPARQRGPKQWKPYILLSYLPTGFAGRVSKPSRSQV